ncbi:hypothetical protein GT94_08220 [Geobacillus stearothermophilus]|uniref:hypothetical protein n=1 Tax=Geobacillus sp. WSUCF-018B TaxID=2055939 RepID=UPI000507A36B|nr:hypothetical protein [Geobacillus sp. WSUCF-018B]KFL15567.1 hypothetical protein ET31_11350 [Geobacillus stearothermophilus]KFX34574.1 hypothetical protein GT94_08220 [Geobacillus stearothermophilus]PJW18850.1 hypothetical protein CV944_01190 [Geobacillus sp. WSUCF-018B]
MRRDQRGYSLITTLLVITVFLLLGLTIVTTAVEHAQFTTVRVDDVQSLHEAKTDVNEAVADLKAELSDPNFLVRHRIFAPDQWDQFLGLGSSSPGEDTIAGRLRDRYGVIMEDESEQYDIPKNQVFLRALRLTKTFNDGHRTRTVKRLVFVTNTPSFLKYALGSKETVVLNGGVYVENGNVYTGQNAYASNATNYVKANGQLTVNSSNAGMPLLSSSSIWYTNDGQLNACGQTTGCWEASQGRFRMKTNWAPRWPTDVPEPAPTIRQENEDFIDVDFDLTVADKLLQASGILPPSSDYIERMESIQEAGDKNSQLHTLVAELSNQWTSIQSNQPDPNDPRKTLEEVIKEQSKTKPLYLDGNSVLRGDVDIQNSGVNQWLIVNGDLRLDGPTNPSTFVSVRGNFIVLGDLTLTGNLRLDASIYVTGSTKIYQSRIERALNNKGVVLLSKGPLDISRINEFNNPTIPTPNLKGYFYTDSSATIYAVGSYLYIEGGLFAHGNRATAPDTDINGLVVNAFRGQVNGENGEPDRFTPGSDPLSSRLVIRYRPEMLVEQGTGLPFVNRISLVVDRLEVE